MNVRDRMRVVIAGGGVAALEALLALRALAGHLVEVTVLSPTREFVYRPVTVAEAFDRAQARVYDLAEIVADQTGGELVLGELVRVDPDWRIAVSDTGREIAFDALVVATGARPREWLRGALTFRGRADVPAVREVLDDMIHGRAKSVALALPSERMWALPLYELALMTAGHVRERGAVDARIVLVTPEEEPLELFGPAAAAVLAPLLAARGVTLRTASRPALVRGRMLVLAGGAELFADRVITLPRLEGPWLPSLPHDRHGFIPVDAFGRVSGLDDVYAAGDVTAFPLKQGGLAAQQADAVAGAIAARVGAIDAPSPFRPVLRGLLLTGGAPLYLRAEPQRLPREATVAIEAPSRRRPVRDASAAAGQALWWPPGKIAGRYLAPYLATARPVPLGTGLLSDRVAVPGPPVSDAEYQDALELALLLADADARWGDYASALNALDAAEALQGALPPEYEVKRREWRAEERLAVGP
ncbi:MAG TPA: FAD-dependent oxidoreductase [Solirubrobacteraceae bacterium]|nr:FAD-dependent oxidoreductase [Solirubrobacteraceae bacterium]